MSKAALFKFRGRSQIEEAEVQPETNSIEVNGEFVNVNKLTLDSPVSGTVYGTLLNYKGALSALGDAVNQAPYLNGPKAPILYIKPINTIIGSRMPIPLPSDVLELEVGAALGVVIGRTATRVPEHEALDYVSGYTIVNDVSVPHSSVYRPAVREKARDGFCPIGPWIIKRDSLTHPDELNIRVYINEELRQENNTKNLIRSVSQLIAAVTDFMTLNAGDTLLIGVPEHAPLVKSGDQIRIEIEGVGSLDNTIVPEHELTSEGNRL